MDSFLESPIEKDYKHGTHFIRPDGVAIETKPSSPSRFHLNELTYDQLSASERRMCFGSYRNNVRISMGGISTSTESYPETDQIKSVVGYDLEYQDPNRLTVPLVSDFINPVSRGRSDFRQHSYDVPPPPPAPDDNGPRRRALSSNNRAHHSFDSAPYLQRRPHLFNDTSSWNVSRNPDAFLYDQQRPPFTELRRTNLENEPNHFLNPTDSSCRVSSYHESMSNNYFKSKEIVSTSALQRRHQQYRFSDSFVGDRELRRNLDEFDSYNFYPKSSNELPQQPMAQPHQSTMNFSPPTRYKDQADHDQYLRHQISTNSHRSDYQNRGDSYYSQAPTEHNPSSGQQAGMFDRFDSNSSNFHQGFSTQHQLGDRKDKHFNQNQTVGMKIPTSSTDDHDRHQFDPFQSQPQSQVNIIKNRNYWEWNNNNGTVGRGFEHHGNTTTYNPILYPDVLHKDTKSGYGVRSLTLHFILANRCPALPGKNFKHLL